MIIWMVNRAIVERCPFSATGLTVLSIVYDEAGGQFSTPAVNEIGATGVYWMTFTPDAIGDWTGYFYCVATGERHTFHYPVYDALATTDTHDITIANDQIETEVFEIQKTGVYDCAITLELDILESTSEGGIVTFRVYEKTDGSVYSDIPVGYAEWTNGDNFYPSFFLPLVHGYVQLKVQCSDDVTVTRVISYTYKVQDQGA